MKKIYIFGTGKGAERVYNYLKLDRCVVLGFIDNDKEHIGTEFMGKNVVSIEKIEKDYDYIIISTIKKEFISEIFQQLLNLNIFEEKIILFFEKNKVGNLEEYKDFIDVSAWKLFFVERELENWKRLVCEMDNKYSKMLGQLVTKEKVSIYIWGTGKGAKEILSYLYLNRCNILGYIDNNEEKSGQIFEGKPICSFNKIKQEYDYIIISTKILEYTRSILIQLEEYNVDADKVIPFYDNEKVIIKNQYADFVNIDSWRGVLLNREINNYERAFRIRIENMKYEIMDEVQNNKIVLPTIAPIEKTLDMIINQHCSIVRFGDGELGLIDKCRFHKFQKDDDGLAKRLHEVLNSNEPGCLVAIADNYGSLEKMTERGAESIRIYMTSGAREIQMKLLDLDREYHNAYLTRPYIYFKDKEHAGERFADIKRIWENKDVVIIEGHQTRLGVGNDLLDNTKSVRRILGPSTNAFDYYNQIVEEASKIEKTAIFLLALGPTATVLAYDLYKMGYQAIDIGHIDVEYEWYKLGVDNPVKLGNKYVCETPNGDEVEEISDKNYLAQIVARVY